MNPKKILALQLNGQGEVVRREKGEKGSHGGHGCHGGFWNGRWVMLCLEKAISGNA
jgi:hypothetical protein